MLSIGDILLIQRCKLFKRERVENTYHADSNRKKIGVAVLISNKIDIKTKIDTTNEDRHLVIRKVSIHQENTAITNTHVPNSGVPKSIKQKLKEWKGDIVNKTVTVGDFNTFFK